MSIRLVLFLGLFLSNGIVTCSTLFLLIVLGFLGTYFISDELTVSNMILMNRIMVPSLKRNFDVSS